MFDAGGTTATDRVVKQTSNTITYRQFRFVCHCSLLVVLSAFLKLFLKPAKII